MTKRDYELLADVVSHARDVALHEDIDAVEAVDALALELGRRLEELNPRFSLEKFVEACR